MKQLKESILSDMDDALSSDNAYELAYPVPKVRDFQKHVIGGFQYVDWYCPNLINQYISYLDTSVYGLVENVVGFRVTLHSKHEMSLFLLIDKNGSKTIRSLEGFGADGSSIPNAKKSAIEFFAHLSKNQDDFKKVFNHANKSKAALYKRGLCDDATFKKVLGY